MASGNVNTAVEHLYRTGKYSDLEVRCGDLVAKVHKSIVCAQSEWFSRAVEEGRFLEGHAGLIEFKDEKPAAVKAMLQYIYCGSYDLEDENEGEDGRMLEHLDIYAIADLIQHNDLKRTVETKFALLVEDDWALGCFPAAMRKVFEVSPPGAQGEALRKIAIDITVKHSRKIGELHGDHFESMLEQVPWFAAGVTMALLPLAQRPPDREPRVRRCRYCQGYVLASPDTSGFMYCPRGNGCSHSPIDEASYRTFRCSRGHSFQYVNGSSNYPVTKCAHCSDNNLTEGIGKLALV